MVSDLGLHCLLGVVCATQQVIQISQDGISSQCADVKVCCYFFLEWRECTRTEKQLKLQLATSVSLNKRRHTMRKKPFRHMAVAVSAHKICLVHIQYYKVIALIFGNISPSWDTEGRELAIFTNISAITLLLYSYNVLFWGSI